MPSNRTSNDIDLVQPTQYKAPLSRVAKKKPPQAMGAARFRAFAY
jgi:hypothetical protein